MAKDMIFMSFFITSPRPSPFHEEGEENLIFTKFLL